jgi:hypothetical protein
VKTPFVLVIALALLSPAILTAAELGPVEIAPEESGVQRTRFEKGQDTIYNYKWTLKRDGSRVTVTARGDNNKSGAKRVEWAENSVLEWTGRGVRTISWSKDSSGAEQESWKLAYDWAGHKMVYTWHDRVSGKKETKTIELGPKAMPADAMYFMMRGFPFEKGVGTRIDADFVLTDGQILPGYIVLRGEERIQTPMGALDTYKLEMKLSGALGGLAPKMFMWFTKSKPHLFVRYDGKDAGLTKGRTTNELLKYTPSESIKTVPAQEAANQ